MEQDSISTQDASREINYKEWIYFFFSATPVNLPVPFSLGTQPKSTMCQ